MKSDERDKVEGAFHRVKGKTKEEIGDALDNEKMEAEGHAEHLKGSAQQKRGEIKDALD